MWDSVRKNAQNAKSNHIQLLNPAFTSQNFLQLQSAIGDINQGAMSLNGISGYNQMELLEKRVSNGNEEDF
jgi:hypothetical protein